MWVISGVHFNFLLQGKQLITIIGSYILFSRRSVVLIASGNPNTTHVNIHDYANREKHMIELNGDGGRAGTFPTV